MKKPYGHVIPKSMQDTQRSASTLLSPDPLHPIMRLSHAEKTKNLLHKQKSGTLCTLLARDEQKFPFGSIVNFALDAEENIFFFASNLAEHTQNLKQTSNRASLFVSEELGDKSKGGDQLAVSRATVVGNVKQVNKSQELVDIFQKRHPQAYYVKFEDFNAYMFAPVVAVRFIAGFGEMSWVDSTSFSEARSDAVSLNSQSAVEHMNADHSDANVDIVNKFAGLPSPCTAASMLSIDRYGIDFLAITGEGKRLARVSFPQTLTSPQEIKPAIIALARQAKL